MGKLTIVSLDGIDGSGKSTLADSIRRRFPQWVVLDEFSDTEMGHFLRDQVAVAPHFIARSEVSQSLLFLSEYAERMAALAGTAPIDAANMTVVERGWLSKYSYQVCVLDRLMAHSRAHKLVADILSVIPQPDASVLLRVAEDVMVDRLRKREVQVDRAFRMFVARADALMLTAVRGGYPAFVIDTSFLTPEGVADLAIPYILNLGKARGANMC
jgi:thymidylate kinase